MALVSGPAAVFLDEPAGGVNPSMIGDLKIGTAYLNQNDGMTFAVVEHNMEFIFGLADRVVVLEQGRILDDGHTRPVAEQHLVGPGGVPGWLTP